VVNIALEDAMHGSNRIFRGGSCIRYDNQPDSSQSRRYLLEGRDIVLIHFVVLAVAGHAKDYDEIAELNPSTLSHAEDPTTEALPMSVIHIFPLESRQRFRHDKRSMNFWRT
jgi:hypothetical protein